MQWPTHGADGGPLTFPPLNGTTPQRENLGLPRCPQSVGTVSGGSRWLGDKQRNVALENEKLVVPASGAKFGKTLLGGGFRVVYPCPRCKRELETENDAVAVSDKCPHCGASFVFDDRIKEAFLALAAEKRAHKASKQAEVEAVRLAQAEKEVIREAKRQEGFRLVKESEDRAAREYEHMASDYKAQARFDKQAREKNARSVDGAYAFLTAVLIVGGIGTTLGLLRAILAGVEGDSYLAGALLVAGVSAAVSLLLVYVFFRILEAIHAVLVMILDKLPPPKS